MSDIVERLRQKALGKRNALGDVWGEWLCDEAAAEIERLRAENVALRQSALQHVKEANRHQARLAEAVEVVRGLMEWAEPLAGDNCDPLAASEETRSVEFARAFLAKMEPAPSP